MAQRQESAAPKGLPRPEQLRKRESLRVLKEPRDRKAGGTPRAEDALVTAGPKAARDAPREPVREVRGLGQQDRAREAQDLRLLRQPLKPPREKMPEPVERAARKRTAVTIRRINTEMSW